MEGQMTIFDFLETIQKSKKKLNEGPLKHKYCTHGDCICACHTEDGCQFPYKCGLSEEEGKAV